MNMPELTKEEVLEAITEGVRQAIFPTVNEVGDELIAWKRDILNAISAGVDAGLGVYDDSVLEAIREGVDRGLGVWGEQVLGAIAYGTKEAMQP